MGRDGKKHGYGVFTSSDNSRQPRDQGSRHLFARVVNQSSWHSTVKLEAVSALQPANSSLELKKPKLGSVRYPKLVAPLELGIGNC